MGIVVRDTPPAGAAVALDPAGGALSGVGLAQLAAVAFGVLVVTTEYHNSAIQTSLTVVPTRLPLIWSKAVLVAVVTTVVSLLTLAITFVVAAAVIGVDDVSISLTTPGVARAMLGAGLALAAIGVLASASGGSAEHRRRSDGHARRALPAAQRCRTAATVGRGVPAQQRGRRDHSGATRPGLALPVDWPCRPVRLCGPCPCGGGLDAAAPRRLTGPDTRRLEQFGTQRRSLAMTTQQSHLGTTHQDRPAVADVEQHSVARALVLALAPGVLLATAFYLTAPLAIRAGYPPIFAGVVCGAVIVVGGELGWLLREAHRQTGAWSISKVLPYRPAPFTWRKVLLVIGLFAWAFAVSVLGIGGSIKDEFFAWMPQWALNPIAETYTSPGTTTAEVVTAVGFLMILVILAPLVEELYFRGYLMPRIGRFGAWAALINVSLFAFYHLWKPWDSLNLILILAPMVYAVWRTKDIRIGIAVHIMLNSLAWILNVAPTLLLN